MYSQQVQRSVNVIQESQMEPIIDAILEGKYSSACLLLLEAAGYDPLHYIPYRTYNRLQKQRQQAVREARRTAHSAGQYTAQPAATVTSLRPKASALKMADLDFAESLEDAPCEGAVHGSAEGAIEGGFSQVHTNVHTNVHPNVHPWESAWAQRLWPQPGKRQCGGREGHSTYTLPFSRFSAWLEAN